MSSSKTYRGVFIIESTKEDDEEGEVAEGKALTEMLKLAKIPVIYKYIRTQKELQKMLEQFEGTTYRYLHLACHGNRECIALTYDTINLRPLADLLAPFMNNKRLFISACQAAQLPLAEPLLNSSTCTSVVGPATDVYFRDATIVWASFYVLMAKKDPKKMVRADIKANMKRVCEFFGSSFNGFFRENGNVVMEPFRPRRFPRLAVDSTGGKSE